MSERASSPRCVENVRFVWVAEDKEEGKKGFWFCYSHSQRVAVYEPDPNTEEWMVLMYKAGSTLEENRNWLVKDLVEKYEGTEKVAWRKAAEWAKRPVGVDKELKLIDGVPFVWVQNYAGSVYGNHWVSIDSPRVVRVWEPKESEEEWCVKLLNAKLTYAEKNYAGTQKIAWEKAAEWAKLSSTPP